MTMMRCARLQDSLVRSLGYSAFTFASADEFLKSDVVSNTSCLISDVRMPGLSGLDLQDRLIAQGHRFPIIFVTGHPADIARTRAMNAGAAGFLIKPVNYDRLVSYLATAVRTT